MGTYARINQSKPTVLQLSKKLFYFSNLNLYLYLNHSLITIKSFYKITDIINGALIYSIGDSIAALIIKDFSIGRLLGILFLGGFIYSAEIPKSAFMN